MTIGEMYCRWAERKYGIPGVIAVEFTADDGDEAYSEYTPGHPAEFAVIVKTAERSYWQDEKVSLVPALIREITEFALAGEANERQLPGVDGGEVRDANGKVVSSAHLIERGDRLHTEIPTGDLPEGVYTVAPLTINWEQGG